MNWSILQPEMVYFLKEWPLLWVAMLSGAVSLSLYSMHDINKNLVFRRVYSSLPDWVVTSVSIVNELLQVHCNRMCLQLLSSHELGFIVDTVLCTG